MPSPIVRQLSADDVEHYKRIRLSALRTTPDAFGTTYDAEAALPNAQHARRLEMSVVFGAFAGERIVGLVGCKRYDGERERHKAFLWGFYVEPECRRAGVARALLAASLDAVQGDVEQILLTVVADNRPAIALYERFGFRTYGMEPRSLVRSGGYVDELLMILFLTDRPPVTL